MPPHPGRPGRSRVPPSRITSFLDRSRLAEALAPLVPDPHDRAFVVRCLLDEGPAHHRGANFALVSLLLTLLDALSAAPGPPLEPRPVPMRLPPHLAEAEADYPLALDVAPLRRIVADEGDLEVVVDCLTDGPPQHALANVLMVDLIGVAIAALDARRA